MKLASVQMWIGVCLAVLGIPGIAQAYERGIVGWGSMVIVEQSALEGCVAVAAGGAHSLSLKSDSTIVAWGSNNSGQCNVPEPNAGFGAVAAGGNDSWGHSLDLKSNGSIVAWGQRTRQSARARHGVRSGRCRCEAQLLGNGDGTFGTMHYYGTGDGPSSVAIGDLTGTRTRT